jgi:UDP-N-acetylmuramoylalanine--D-glutamate ligase
MDFRGRRVTVMGLGHFGGGAAAARWLARQGAVVTVTDLAGEDVLTDALSALAGVPIAARHLGGHRDDDFRGAQLVVVNPAVRPGDPFVEIARLSGAAITTEIELFLRECPARTIGVTGSNGKSTTAAMTAAILRADGRRTWLGGNIGESLLESLDQIGPGDWVVVELSSFQLWHLGTVPIFVAGRHKIRDCPPWSSRVPMPHVAVVTNCTPNHLDWHGDMAAYRAAKQRILTGQRQGDLAILNPMDPEVRAWGPLVRGRQIEFFPETAVPRLRLPGPHYRVDAACAATAARGVGCGEAIIRDALGRFAGLPQRTELVAMIGGRRFYNDSSSTTPESTIAALESLERPLWLLAGGKDKGMDLDPLCESMVRLASGVALYGAARQVLHEKLVALKPVPELPKSRRLRKSVTVESLAEAFHWCWDRSKPGDAILLSPGCASTDQFQNYRRRGEAFVELIRGLTRRD